MHSKDMEQDKQIVIEILKESGTVDIILRVEGSVFLAQDGDTFFFTIYRNCIENKYILEVEGVRKQEIWFPAYFKTKDYEDRSMIEYIGRTARHIAEAVCS